MNKNIDPILSIIIPNYNHSIYLSNLIKDIDSHKLDSYEIFIMDDASTDDSIDVIKYLVDQYKSIQYHSNTENMGVIYTANLGASLAKGRYIYFAAADDLILPGFFSESLEMLAKNPSAGLCSGLSETINEFGHKKPINPDLPSKVIAYFSPDRCMELLIKKGTWMRGTSTIFRRDAFIESGGLNEAAGPVSDILVEMIIAAKYGVCFIPKLFSYQRLISNSYSAIISKDTNKLISYYEVASLILKNNYRNLFDVKFINYWSKREILFCKLSAFKRSIINLINCASCFFSFNSKVINYIIFLILTPFLILFFSVITLLNFKESLDILKKFIIINIKARYKF